MLLRCRSLPPGSFSRTSRESAGPDAPHRRHTQHCCTLDPLPSEPVLIFFCFNAHRGIPAMVDLAAMRDALVKHGVDPYRVNPVCPTDLIVDHSLQIDFSKW